MATTERAEPVEGALREHLLGEADVDQALALVAEAGWNQVAADWRIFLDYGTVFGISSAGGRLIATAATLPYGGQFSWISMVLVTAACRNRGLATRLMRRAIDECRARGLVPILDATAAGREVYSRIGFRDCWGLERLMLASAAGVPAAPVPDGVRVAALPASQLESVASWDAGAFGADRLKVLARLRERQPASAFVASRAGAPAGYVLAREGRTATQIGPVVAEDEAVAMALIAAALGTLATPVTIDVALRCTATGAWLRGLGFTVQRGFTRMALERERAFDDGRRIVAAAGPELG